MNLQGSKTEENLKEALKGECVAANKYAYYTSQAKKDGYEQIKRIFEQTANNEKEHAKIWFKLLIGGKIKSTKENLQDALKSESYEHNSMYPEFARIACQEGFNDIAKLFNMVAKIESYHEERFRTLLENVENKQVFKKNDEQNRECSNCGYCTKDTKAPDVCPVCKHKQAFFFIKNEKF